MTAARRGSSGSTGQSKKASLPLLRERLETMVSEKRAQRAPECDIWTEVGRIAVSQ